jgi:biotin synthase
MLNSQLFEITEQIINQPDYSVSYEDACIIAETDPVQNNDIFICIDKIRRHFKKDRVFLCSIINGKSGKCSQDCSFCAQSSFHNTKIDTYPLMSVEEITRKAFLMEKNGATHYSIVTSGLSLDDEEIDRVCRAVEIIKKKNSLVICGSLGILSENKAKKLIASGMTRYHHNLETARSHFDKICTTHTYDEDIETINTAIANGFRVCSGGIFGLGESWEQRVELAFTLRELQVDTIPVNFLNPVAGTRMENMPVMTPMDALKCIALLRIINPEKSITICGGRELTLKDFQSWLFSAGANGLMIGNYLTTSGRNMEMDIEMIQDAGLVRKQDYQK